MIKPNSWLIFRMTIRIFEKDHSILTKIYCKFRVHYLLPPPADTLDNGGAFQGVRYSNSSAFCALSRDYKSYKLRTRKIGTGALNS